MNKRGKKGYLCCFFDPVSASILGLACSQYGRLLFGLWGWAIPIRLCDCVVMPVVWIRFCLQVNFDCRLLDRLETQFVCGWMDRILVFSYRLCVMNFVCRFWLWRIRPPFCVVQCLFYSVWFGLRVWLKGNRKFLGLGRRTLQMSC